MNFRSSCAEPAGPRTPALRASASCSTHYLSPTLVKFNSTLLKSLTVHHELAETAAPHKGPPHPPATAELFCCGPPSCWGARVVRPTWRPDRAAPLYMMLFFFLFFLTIKQTKSSGALRSLSARIKPALIPTHKMEGVISDQVTAGIITSPPVEPLHRWSPPPHHHHHHHSLCSWVPKNTLARFIPPQEQTHFWQKL